MDYADIDKRLMKSTAKDAAETLVSKIDDPTDRLHGDLFYRKKPRVKSQSFGGYPYIHLDGVNIINSNASADGTLVEFTVDIELHVWGREDTEDGPEDADAIVSQLLYLLTGPEKANLSEGTGMTAPNIIRNVDFTGINQKDQPVTRQEMEFRTTIHKVMA